jgi:hypothetical protein
MARPTKARLAAVALRLAEAARVASRALSPYSCAIVGAIAGLAAGWFGLAAGLVIGLMLDIARLEARTRSRLANYLRKPEAEGQGEGAPRLAAAVPGFAAAACLAFRGDWPGAANFEARRLLWDRLAIAALPPDSGARREADRVADVAARCSGADLPGLARLLAISESSARSRRLLADWAFAAAALGRCRLDADTELRLRAALGDCGVGAEELAAARLASFPGERDPWTVLGLAPGAPRSEVKRAYRRLSRVFHPDAAGGSDGERFREVSEAYRELSSSVTYRRA